MVRHTRSQAVILYDKYVLILKHFNSKNKEEYWMLPGGNVEEGESPRQAITRELSEECRVLTRSLSLLDDRIGDGSDYYLRYVTFLCYLSDKPRVEPGKETVSYRKIIDTLWVDLTDESSWDEKLKSKQFYPSLREIRQLISRQNNEYI